jgi:predicted PurR-regulated permease PerM
MAATVWDGGYICSLDTMSRLCAGRNVCKATAILFTIYMVPVNLLDNILRPLVAKGLKTPMLVISIGVLGGTLAHGIVGLFVGPIVLSIAWQLLAVWTHNAPKTLGCG